MEEAPVFETYLEQLLTHLATSDFALAFPCRPARCTVHHHKQLWWQSTDVKVIAALDALVSV